MPEVQNMCPICGVGELKPHIAINTLTHNGISYKVPLEYSECSFCGSEVADTKQCRANKKAMIQFKK